MFNFQLKKIFTNNKDLIAVAFFFLLSFLYFFNGFLKNQIIWGFDTPKIIFPFIFLLDESFKSHKLPLWTPDIYFGFPIGADGQISWYYPFSILHIFLPWHLTVLILTFLHVFLAGLFTYVFARIINLNRFASIFAGIVFMFNGFIIAHLQYFSHIYAYTYLPLVLLFIELAISKGNYLYFFLAGGSFGLQLLSGHPNIPVMTIIYVSLYTLLRNKAKISQFFVGISLTVVTAFIIALPYILYALRLIPLSIRSNGVDFVDATNSSLSFFDFITFFFPNFYFNNLESWTSSINWHFWGYWGQIETTGYVGVITLFLMPFSLLRRTRKKARIFFILSFVGLLLALGKNTPLYRLLLNIPIFNGLRAPGRFLFLVDFSLAILAGFGITALFQTVSAKKIKINVGITVSVFLIYTLVLIGSFLVKFHPELIYDFLSQNYSKLGYVANIESPHIFQQMVLRSFQDQTKIGLTLIAVSTILILLLWNGLKNYLTKFLVLGLIIADLFIFSSKVNTWKSFDELIIHTDPIINKLKTELNDSTGRVYTFSNSWSNLVPNQLIPYHIPDANGFSSLPLKRFQKWQSEAEKQWLEGKTDLFKMASVKYIYERGNLLTVDNSLPKAYLASKWIIAKNGSETLRFVNANNFDMNSVVLETKDIKDYNRVGTSTIIPLTISRYKPNYVKIDSNTPYDGILVLTDTNYPGWEAYLNDKNVPIYQANYLFRGIKVPAGFHTIEFKYRPEHLNTAVALSLSTSFLILFLSVKRLLKGKLND